MIKSMTGYGRSKQLIGTKNILVEIKSVNSRYLDLSIKLPRMFSPLEEKVKQMVSKYIARAKVDIYISIDDTAGEKVDLTVNKEYLEGLLKALKSIKEDYNIGGEITIDMIAAKNDIFNMKKADEDMDELWAMVMPVVLQSIELYNEMREKEGANLKADLLGRISAIEKTAYEIKERTPCVVAEYNEKIRQRIQELLNGVAVDEARLLNECAIFADKQDITEEITRLTSHIMQFRSILDEDAPVGRKLDFLVQEINREVNTCGSKANDRELSRLVIEAKCEIEKIREQIQNLE